MAATPKEQLLLRFDPEVITRLKMRAKILNRSLNSHMLALALKDLQEAQEFPKVIIPDIPDKDLLTMAGKGNNLPSEKELAADEKLAALWRR